LTILAATVPIQMAEPTVAFDSAHISYVISIQAANSGGADVPILEYEIQVQTNDGSF
jgi:hypothetical protein